MSGRVQKKESKNCLNQNKTKDFACIFKMCLATANDQTAVCCCASLSLASTPALLSPSPLFDNQLSSQWLWNTLFSQVSQTLTKKQLYSFLNKQISKTIAKFSAWYILTNYKWPKPEIAISSEFYPVRKTAYCFRM